MLAPTPVRLARRRTLAAVVSLAASPSTAGAFVAAARRVITGADGHYSFGDVTGGLYVLHVYRLGFRPAAIEVELRADAPRPGSAPSTAADSTARVSVGLTVVPIRLHPVAVEAAAPEPYARHAGGARATADARQAALRVRQARFLSTDAREVTHADVEDAVTLGETDLFRALQRLPGVATQGDASAQLFGLPLAALSGAPTTPAFVEVVYFDSAGTVLHKAPNRLASSPTARLPRFLRLDLTAEKTWAIRRARVGGYLQIINATGRRNPLGVNEPYSIEYPQLGGLKGGNGGVPNGFITLPLIGLRASF